MEPPAGTTALRRRTDGSDNGARPAPVNILATSAVNVSNVGAVKYDRNSSGTRDNVHGKAKPRALAEHYFNGVVIKTVNALLITLSRSPSHAVSTSTSHATPAPRPSQKCKSLG